MRSSNSSPSRIIVITLLPDFIVYFALCFVVNEELKNMCNGLPLFLEGKVCKGFGRGSKELGCPTGTCVNFNDECPLTYNFESTSLTFLANFDENVEKLLPAEVLSGVYFGWAQVENGPVYKMVMSIGWNPFFKNEKRSIVSIKISSNKVCNDCYSGYFL